MHPMYRQRVADGHPGQFVNTCRRRGLTQNLCAEETYRCLLFHLMRTDERHSLAALVLRCPHGLRHGQLSPGGPAAQLAIL